MIKMVLSIHAQVWHQNIQGVPDLNDNPKRDDSIGLNRPEEKL